MPVIKGLHAKLLAQRVKKIMTEKGYAFFESGKFNVNIVGIRSSNKRANEFDDMILLLYKNKKEEWEVISSVITTDPGEYYLVDNPVNSKGTAILIPDQYRGVYQIGIHAESNKNFAHEALCQRGAKLRVWRDNNFDNILDHNPESVDEGWFGVNIHRSKSSGVANYVGAYSAGCQVFKNSTDFKLFLDVVKRSRDLYGNSFTYTLLEEKDFEE